MNHIMKKLSYLLWLLFLATPLFVACSDDDDPTPDPEPVVVSFEGKLTGANTEFTSTSTTEAGYYFYDTFQDNANLLTFDHYYSEFNGTVYPAGFTYTNNTDKNSDISTASVTGAGKFGTTYLYAFQSSHTPVVFTINDPGKYSLSGAWVTNSVWAYNAMTTDKISGTTPFSTGSWFKLKAIGYDARDAQTGTAELYLANYASNSDKPLSQWTWFDMSGLSDAVKVEFELSSTDNGDYGMNTPAYFCLDGITLVER